MYTLSSGKISAVWYSGTLNSKNKRLFSIRHCTIYSKIEFCIILLHVSGGIFELIRRQHKARKLDLAFTDQCDHPSFYLWWCVLCHWYFFSLNLENMKHLNCWIILQKWTLPVKWRILFLQHYQDVHLVDVQVCAIPIHLEGVVDLSGTKMVGHVCYIQALYFREPVHTL